MFQWLWFLSKYLKVVILDGSLAAFSDLVSLLDQGAFFMTGCTADCVTGRIFGGVRPSGGDWVLCSVGEWWIARVMAIFFLSITHVPSGGMRRVFFPHITQYANSMRIVSIVVVHTSSTLCCWTSSMLCTSTCIHELWLYNGSTSSWRPILTRGCWQGRMYWWAAVEAGLTDMGFSGLNEVLFPSRYLTTSDTLLVYILH